MTLKKAISALAAALFVLASCNNGAYIQITGYAQGGTYTVKCRLDSRRIADAEILKSGMDSLLAVIDRSVSGYNPGSLLSRYNNGEAISDDGSPEYAVFSHLTAYCDSLFITTEGVLDTRAAALFDVWGFGFKEGRMPDAEAVAAAKEDRSKMNFNAVAQGYSADLIGSYLRSKGITDMMVNIGGEIYCNGVNPNGEGWKLAIDTPVDGNDTPGAMTSATVVLEKGRECGIVTSGNYRKFYIENGEKYSHTIDPRTGAPVKHNLLSATIIAPTSALADALATYCMVVGKEEAAAMIESRDDLEGCLITSDGIWYSKGITLDR